jgi:hypothetical protein
VARRQLGKRLWTIYTGGAPSTLGQLLGADSIHQALVTTKYQEEVVGADRTAVDRVEQLRRQVEALATKLADQAERQQRLQARLAALRRYHQRLTRQVRRAVAEERRRQETLRRRALLRRLAAYRRAGVWLPKVSREQWNAGPPRRPGRPGPGRPGVLRLQRRQPRHHPPRRYVRRRRRHGRGPLFRARVRIASIGRRDCIGAVRPTG